MGRVPPLYTQAIFYADAVSCLENFLSLLQDQDFLRQGLGVMRTKDTWALRKFVSKLKNGIEGIDKAEISTSAVYREMIKALPTLHQQFISEELYLELLNPFVDLCFGTHPAFAAELKSFWSTAVTHSRKQRLM